MRISDVPYFRKEFSFEPYIAFYERIFDRIGLPERLRERVSRRNARWLFGRTGGE